MRITLSDAATLFHADCREALREIPDCSVDSCCTDPPYALTQASRNGSARTNDPDTPFGRTKLGERGFMGRTWDTGETAFSTGFWAEVYRVLKPGAFVAAFGASRGYHRMAVAIEDAGFEIRDSLMWIYGTGFPKSQDVSKFIDKELGAEREKVKPRSVIGHQRDIGNVRPYMLDPDHMTDSDEPATPQAAEWQGFGTALKPAFEPIVLARKPLSEPTVAANVLRWRTGALNIDGCRVPGQVNSAAGALQGYGGSSSGLYEKGTGRGELREGRWPANVVTDGSDEVVAMFPTTKSGQLLPHHKRSGTQNIGTFAIRDRSGEDADFGGDSGSAARFFYSAKASKADRAGSKHPTVKPISLMEWLCTLITPPGGTILDPFAGSGTTGVAATRKGFRVILCEREAEYVADIRSRFGTPSPSWSDAANRDAHRETALLADVEALCARLQARLRTRLQARLQADRA